MRPTTIALLLTLKLTLPCTVEAADTNPFSRYSPKWDAAAYRKAKPKYSRDITKTDRELTHMVNMMRIDPVLFGQTVLLPHARRSGRTRQAELFLQRCGRPGRMKPLEITVYHRFTAKRLLDSLRRSGPDLCRGGGYPLNDSASARFAWRRSGSGNPIDILMDLILDAHACSIGAAEALLADARTVGILVRGNRESGFETGIVVDAMDTKTAMEAKRPSICDDFTMEEQRIIEFSTDTTDAVLKALGKKNPLPEGVEARLVDYKTYRRIRDSLIDNCVSYHAYSDYYDHEMGDKDLKPLERDPSSDPRFPGGPRSSGGDKSCIGHPEKSMYVYSMRRNTSVCSGVFEFEHHYLSVTAPQFIYHPDSIGRVDPDPIDLMQADLHADTIVGSEAETLAAALTHPFQSELQKVRAIHTWLASKVDYDEEGLKDGTVSDDVDEVLRRKKAICKGYAETFKRLCELAGIRCRSVRGYVEGSFEVNHRWNTVNIDGKWYLVDVTWGSWFFLMPPESFLEEHLPEDDSYTLLPKYVGWVAWNEAFEKRKKEREEGEKTVK